MVLPIEEGRPNYRDTIPPPFEILKDFNPLNMASIASAPEVTAISEVRCLRNARTSFSQPAQAIAKSIFGAWFRLSSTNLNR